MSDVKETFKTIMNCTCSIYSLTASHHASPLIASFIYLFESPFATFKHQTSFVGKLFTLPLKQLRDGDIFSTKLSYVKQQSYETDHSTVTTQDNILFKNQRARNLLSVMIRIFTSKPVDLRGVAMSLLFDTHTVSVCEDICACTEVWSFF